MRIAFAHNVQRTNRPEEAEFDTPETIRLIEGALVRLGHQVLLVDVLDDLATIVARLRAFAPDLIFNTAEGTRGRFREAFYPALFESLGIPYCGSDPYTCAVTLDKHATKLLVAEHGVRTPRGAFLEGSEGPCDVGLPFPLIVKPNFEGSSKGITQENVVEDEAVLRRQVAAMRAAFPEGILVEEFIPGADVTVAYLEAASPETGGILEPCRYEILNGAGRRYAIYDFELKQYLDDKVQVRLADDLTARVRRDLLEMSRTVCRALNVRDVARLDYRLGDDGQVYFLEINALPSLQEGASIYVAAARHGLTSETAVIGKIVESACRRAGLPVPEARPAAA